jgi:hypothetical protein
MLRHLPSDRSSQGAEFDTRQDAGSLAVNGEPHSRVLGSLSGGGVRALHVLIIIAGIAGAASANEAGGAIPQGAPSARSFVFQWDPIVQQSMDRDWQQASNDLDASGDTKIGLGAGLFMPLGVAGSVAVIASFQNPSNLDNGWVWGGFLVSQVLTGVGIGLIVEGTADKVTSDVEEIVDYWSHRSGSQHDDEPVWSDDEPVRYGVSHRVDLPRSPWGVIRATTPTEVFYDPSPVLGSLAQLAEGDEVVYWGFDQSYAYYQVQLDDGSFGFVRRDDAEVIAGKEAVATAEEIAQAPAISADTGAVISSAEGVQACFRDYESSELRAVDRIEVEIEVRPAGRANWARISTSEFRWTGLDTCVSNAILEIDLPPFGGWDPVVMTAAVTIERP